ncbi:MAG: DNA repair protein RecO [Mollicutes bacterium]|nr:DNA repair protein RecO [Mollicutes bacterium]
MITKVKGFVLNETSYGETSKIINVYTEEKGLIGIMCKGAKSMKSKLRAFTQVFTYGYFHIYYKKDKLSSLINVDIIDNLSFIKKDLLLINYITYISKLTSQIIRQTDKNVFDLFINSIIKINEGLDPMTITNILELKYLPFLGVGLDLNSCVKCNNQTKIVTIDGSSGGFICKNCIENQLIVDPKVIKLIRLYYYVDIKSISTINVKEEYKKTINKFLMDYYDNMTGIYIDIKKKITLL